MKKLILILSLLSLIACEAETKKQVKEKKTVNTKKKAKKKEIPVLNNNNVKEELIKYGEENPENIVIIHSSFGDIKIKLYEETPLHRANFVMLAKREYYNGSEFHRVVKDFVVQGGDTDDRTFAKKKRKIGKYKIPAEIQPTKYFHKRGAIALAREYENNPEKRSSSFDFYIVTGTMQTENDLLGVELVNAKYNLKIDPKVRSVYKKIGGTPHLDNEHTVFGEVIEGMEVISQIEQVKVSEEDNWPLESIRIQSVEVVRE